MNKCYKCRWWNYSYGCQWKKGVCHYKPLNSEWIDVWEDGMSTKAICSNCKKESDRPLGNFCKWCGARMFDKDTNVRSKEPQTDPKTNAERCPYCGMGIIVKGSNNCSWCGKPITDEPQIKLCRECEDYAGDGMFCAKNYMVFDFSKGIDKCEAKPQRDVVALDKATLIDYFINSVDENDEPVWTERHIDEILKDFDVVSKTEPQTERSR